MKTNDKVRMMRELHHWSQEEMAAKLSMSTNGYAKIERGETRLNIPKLEQIADIFGVDLVELLSLNERSVVCLISENSTYSSNYYGTSQELNLEIERLRTALKHKDELLAQKEQLLTQQAREIDTLRALIDTMRSQE